MPQRHCHSPPRTPFSASTALLLDRLERFHHVMDGEFVEIVASHGDQPSPLIGVLAEAHSSVKALDRSCERWLMLARFVERGLHRGVEIAHRLTFLECASTNARSSARIASRMTSARRRSAGSITALLLRGAGRVGDSGGAPPSAPLLGNPPPPPSPPS